MKKLLLILLVLGFTAKTFGYTARVVNQTQEKLRIKVNLHTCADDFFDLAPGAQYDQGTGACCIRAIEASSLSGSVPGARGSGANPGGGSAGCKGVIAYVRYKYLTQQGMQAPQVIVQTGSGATTSQQQNLMKDPSNLEVIVETYY